MQIAAVHAVRPNKVFKQSTTKNVQVYLKLKRCDDAQTSCTAAYVHNVYTALPFLSFVFLLKKCLLRA